LRNLAEVFVRSDPVPDTANPRREFLRRRSVFVSWSDGFELLTRLRHRFGGQAPNKQLKKKRD
jgi:hypothetical protein